MSSELFETHQEEFLSLFLKINKVLNVTISTKRGEARIRLKRETEDDIEQCQNLIIDMENESRRAPAPYRSEMMNKIRKYKRDIDKSANDFKGLALTEGRNEYDASDFDAAERRQRNVVAQGVASLQRTSDSISRAQQVSADTDAIGDDVIQELGTQREQLERTRDRLVDTGDNLSKSRKVLNSMARRAITNKLLLIVIIILEVAILIAVVYWKFFS